MIEQDRNHIDVPGHLKRKMIEAARDFRKNPTPSEALLWQSLRGKQLEGMKFRRQQPIGPFVVDFYAPALRLVVEVDGTIHEQQQEADRRRQEILEYLDLNVMRFSASQVENDLGSVLSAICVKAQEILKLTGKDTPSTDSTPHPPAPSTDSTPHPPTPSPTSGEGEKDRDESILSLLSVRRRGVATQSRGGEVPERNE